MRNLPEVALYTFTCVVFVAFEFLTFFYARWDLWLSLFLVKLTICHSFGGVVDVLVDAP